MVRPAILKNRLWREVISGPTIHTNEENDKPSRRAIRIASTLLFLSSAYTTVYGLTYFVAWPMAISVGLAIQLLLFVFSWRIGGSLAARNLSPSLLASFVVTMGISISFSYLALLNHIYSDTRRQLDFERLVQRVASPLAQDVVVESSAAIRNNERLARERLQDGYREITNAVQAAVTRSGVWAKAVRGSATFDELRYPTRRSTITGTAAAEYDAEVRRVSSLRSRSKVDTAIFAKFQEDMSSFQTAISGASTQLTPDSILVAIGSCSSLVRYVGGLNQAPQSSLCEPIGQVRDMVAQLSILRGRQSEIEKDVDILLANNSVDMRVDALNHLTAGLAPERRESVRREVGEAMRLTNPELHPLESATNLLFKQNHQLANASLAIAMAIDFLILLAAFVAARPRSFLALRRPSDLQDVEDYAISTVLSISRLDPAPGDPPQILEFKRILLTMKADAMLSREGFAGYIASADHPGFRIALGPLLATELAEVRTLSGGETVVALRIRFLLWMADQIGRVRDQQEADADLKGLGREDMEEAVSWTR